MLPGGLTVTVDTLVEGVHFDARLTPFDVGYKAVAVSVSDLAAMGAAPGWAVLSLGLPHADTSWVDAFSEGLATALARWGLTLVGGDTVRSPARTVSLTMTGQLVAEPLTRTGARPGDALWVTGVPGLAGLGWMVDQPPPAALQALRRPAPPLRFALDLAKRGWVQAAMDLSDGLAQDLPRLCRASGCGLTLDPAQLPVHPAFEGASPTEVRQAQLAGGDDYQLLFASAPEAPVRECARDHGITVTRIGTFDDSGVVQALGGWTVLPFQHFGEAS